MEFVCAKEDERLIRWNNIKAFIPIPKKQTIFYVEMEFSRSTTLLGKDSTLPSC